jgi:hypothetical protein
MLILDEIQTGFDPRTHDPRCSATCDHQRPGRLGAGSNWSHVEAGFLVMAMFGDIITND